MTKLLANTRLNIQINLKRIRVIHNIKHFNNLKLKLVKKIKTALIVNNLATIFPQEQGQFKIQIIFNVTLNRKIIRQIKDNLYIKQFNKIMMKFDLFLIFQILLRHFHKSVNAQFNLSSQDRINNTKITNQNFNLIVNLTHFRNNPTSQIYKWELHFQYKFKENISSHLSMKYKSKEEINRHFSAKINLNNFKNKAQWMWLSSCN